MADEKSMVVKILGNIDELKKSLTEGSALIRGVSADVKKSSETLSDMKEGLLHVGEALGITFSVDKVVEFGREIFETASNIHDMSLRLDVSTDAVQGFKAAAEAGGSSLEAVGSAIQKMNQLLGAGDLSTIKALKDAGLSFNSIRSMKPEDAFLAITDALKQMADPMDRARVQLALFGKASGELTPAIVDGFRETAAAAHKMSEDTIADLARAENAWKRLHDEVIVASGNTIEAILNTAKGASSSAAGMALFLDNVIKFGVGAAIAMGDVGTSVTQTGKDIRLALDYNPLDAYKKHLNEVGIGLGDLTREKEALIKQAHLFGESTTDIAKGLGLEVGVVNLVIDAETRHAEAMKKAAEIEKKAIETTAKLWDDYYAEQVTHGGTATEIARANIKQWMLDQIAAADRAGTATKAFYEALGMDAHAKTESLRLDWGKYNDYSQDKLQETADREHELYEEMLLNASHFSRGAIAAQRQIAEDARDAATAWGNPWNKAFDATAAKAAETAAAMKKSFEDAVAAIIKDQQQITAGGSMTYDLSTDEGRKKFEELNPMAGPLPPKEYFKTHTLQQAIEAGLVNLYAKYSGRSFAGGVTNDTGGPAIVGEHGPELVTLPRGANVIPNHQLAGMGSSLTVNVHVHGAVLGTTDALARMVGAAVMAQQRGLGEKFPIGGR